MFRTLFGKATSEGGTGIRRKSSAQLSVEALENREVPASIFFNASSGVLLISGSGQDDVATVNLVNGELKVSLDSYTHSRPTRVFHDSQTFDPADVTKIWFVGGSNDDKFTNNTSEPCLVYGSAGNDILNGGSGDDIINGGSGNDIVHGFGGNDVIKDSGGANTLCGDSGDDRIYGSTGFDVIQGGSDNDTIVAIGGSHDIIFGQTGSDSVWMDATDTMYDISSTENSQHSIHKVNQFLGVSFSGGITNTPVSKELLGQNLIDPLRNPLHTTTTLKNFKSNPLFASGGPSQDDVFQGSVGDCYYVASVAAIADANPEFIRRMVVDLGDGTYAVRFYRNAVPTFVRVDADLWVENGTPKYAKLGQEGSIWVPIVEKAYCFFRKQLSNYPSIASGDGTVDEHLGVPKLVKETGGSVTAIQVAAWDAAGRPAGAIADEIRSRAISLLNWIKTQLAIGNGVSVGASPSYSNTIPFVTVDDPSTEGNETTWRRGKHVFTVHEVLTNAAGTPTDLVVRNPYGTQGPNHDGYITVTDLARIYFCHGGAGALVV